VSDLLAIGASGLRAYRAALNAVGDNVANAQTEGYTRRSVRISEVSVGGAPSVLYRNQTRFDGADIGAVVRAADSFRTADARATAADHGGAQAVASWLTNAERALGSAIGPALSTAFANGDRLAADPVSPASRARFLAGIDAAASAIRTSAGDLARVADGLGDAALAGVDAANADFNALASVNLAIRRQPQGTSAFVELEDQRDRLVDAIATRTGANATIAADGSVKVTHGATVLVALGTATPLGMTRSSDGRIAYATAAGALPLGGALGGLHAASGTIADRRTGLDDLASRFATAINDWHANGRTPAGNAGPPLLVATGGAVALTALSDNPADVAAASGSTANGNALALSAVRTASGVEASAALIVAQQAAQTAAARQAEALSGDRRDGAAAARDAVEGVDLDREAADLLRFQQSYQGAARVIQAAKDIVDTILAIR